MAVVTNVRTDIAKWCVEQLKSELPYLRECFSLARPEEFREIVLNPPSACIIMTKSANSQVQTPPTEVYAYFTIEVWFTADRFRADDSEAGLTDERGIYEMYDDIHSAFSAQTPTSCDEHLEFQEGEVTDLDDGYITAYVEYQTARLI